MALENNQLDGHGDIAQFLEKFKENTFSPANPPEGFFAPREGAVPAKPAQYERSFEKLEQKIRELEDRFEAAAGQNQLILNELARTREAMERQKDKDAFLEHISRTIASLKASVENLSRAQQDRAYQEPPVQRSFDPLPTAFKNAAHPAVYHYDPQAQRVDQEERERILFSLRQKASQLKAVNSALDREIKKVQQEKMEALKKSAEQAKEILSLRDQLTAAEERFKSFDFEGRIISIKQEYQQKVSSLENQLQEISDTCMKQVEEIESLKAENLKLHKAAAEKEEALARLEAKEHELLTLKAEMAALQDKHSKAAQKQLAVFSERLRALEGQRDGLAVDVERAQSSLEAVRQEKDLLEKNFKELLAKINQNDAVIEQLKQKIEVLGQQNEALTRQNETLQSASAGLTQEKNNWQAQAQAWNQEKAALQAQNETLSRQQAELSAQAQALSQEKATLAEQAARLSAENEQLQAVSNETANMRQNLMALQAEKEALSREKDSLSQESQQLKKRTADLEQSQEELSKENQQLRNQSAALLAARLVQEKERATKEELLRKAAPKRPAAPQEEQKRPQNPVAPAAAIAAPVKAEPIPASEKPVTVHQNKLAQVQTDADLPEIKVADPVPQPEPLFDGEDFLEKTDSFIGRMKWSIFREDK